jgi:hypothetical protein
MSPKAAGAALMVLLGAIPVSARTPADCPLRFDSHTIGLSETCLFVGRFNPTCGGALTAVFAGDGEVLVVGIATGADSPILYLPARALSGTQGTMVRWQRDLTMEAANPVGTVQLENDGETLRLRLNGPAVTIGTCRFEEYVGHFVDMVDAAPEPVNASADEYLNP